MQKIVISLFVFVLVFGGFNMAFAQNKDNNGTVMNCVTAPCPGDPDILSSTLPTNIQCVQTAVVAREQAMVTAFNAFTNTMTTALSTRADALTEAWLVVDNSSRITARKTAWTNFRTSSNNAKLIYRQAKRNAWSTFRNASKVCKTPIVESEGSDFNL